MAPARRSVKISAVDKKISTTLGKLPRTRRKNASPLKVPSLITISVPVSTTSLDVPDTEKGLDMKTKMALADEVAKAQLLQQSIEARGAPKPSKKRGRKKVVVSQLYNKAEIKEEPAKEVEPSAATTVKKSDKTIPLIKNPLPKRVYNRKRVAVSTMDEPKFKHQTTLLTSDPIDQKCSLPIASVPKLRKRLTRGKQTCVDTLDNKMQSTPEVLCTKLTVSTTIDSQDPKTGVEDIKSPKPQFSDIKLPKPRSSDIKSPTPRSSDIKSTTPRSSNIKSPIPRSSDIKSPKAQVLIPQFVSPNLQLDNKSLEQHPLGVKSPKPQSLGIKLPRPQPLRIKSSKSQPLHVKSPEPKSIVIKLPNAKSLDIKSSEKATSVMSPKQQSVQIKSPKPQAPSIKGPRKRTDTSKGHNTEPVNARVNSISSISNLSWTRDISMSSTTTCVTVSSNDFVSINNKLPYIELIDIGSELLDKYKNKAVTNDDSSTSDDSSSSDSETSSEPPLSYSSLSPPRHYTSPFKVNSLNLSVTSSSTSNHKESSEKYKFNKIDYGKAAEKLKQVLNKIDIELTNWIGDTDYVLPDPNKITANLITILNNEFAPFTHCRKLRNVLKVDKTGDSYVNITSKHEVATEKNEKENKKVKNKILATEISKTGHKSKTMASKTDSNINGAKASLTQSNSTVNNTIANNLSDFKQLHNIKRCNVVNSPPRANKSDSTENDIVTNKLSNGSPFLHSTICRTEINPQRSNKNENNNVAMRKLRIEDDQITKTTVESYSQEVFAKPSTSGSLFKNKTLSCQEPASDSSSSDSEHFTAGADVNDSIPNGHDDDDALSLFAESITGIESIRSKFNPSIVATPVEKQIEEYIPYPLQNNFIPLPNYSYCPTKIGDQVKNGVIKTVCEKQNADSTSLSKECNRCPTESKDAVSVSNSVESYPEVATKPNTFEENIPHNVNRPLLIRDLYKLKMKETNLLLKGYCYFNLAHRCLTTAYGNPCRYLHDKPDSTTISNRMANFSDEVLIKQYMLIRRNDNIMRMFGVCALLECERRQLTRVVVEIAYDFIMMKHARGHAFIPDSLKVYATEIVLLHLNNINLSEYEDLLKLKVGNSLLGEVFMEVLTKTQNFTRFKKVFLSLTYFLVNNDRTFSLEVAEQVLERVCILAFDEAIVRALIQIIRLTTPEIFLNSMIEKFEKCIKPRIDIFDEYSLVKKEVDFEKLARQVAIKRPGIEILDQRTLTHSSTQPPMAVTPPLTTVPENSPMLTVPENKPLMAVPVDRPLSIRPEMGEGVPLPPSPDTTHDNMNKMAEDTVTPKVTRTIMGRSEAHSTPQPTKTNFSPLSSNDKEFRHQNWKHRSIFKQIARQNILPFRGSVRPHVRYRKPQPNHRLVTFGGSPVVRIIS